MSGQDVFNPFGPDIGQTVSATTTASAGTFSSEVALGSPNILVSNAGPDTIFIRWSYSVSPATTNDIPVLAGTVQNFFKGNADCYSIRTATTTATVYIYPGTGE